MPQQKPDDRQPRSSFKRFFLRGLGVLLPSVLTLWILVAAYQFVSRNIAEPINSAARAVLAWASTESGPLRGEFDPTDEQVDIAMADLAAQRRNPPDRSVVVNQLRAREIEVWWEERWYTRFFGLAVALAGVYLVGRLVGGWVGRRVFAGIERVLLNVPVIKQVYPSVKQIVGFFFSDAAAEEAKLKFNRVVLVQYPRQGIWSVGLLTGTAMRAIEAESGEALTVFVPSSPTPFTGYTIVCRREEVHELPITIDEALRYLVSGGVVIPPHQEGPRREPLPAPTVAEDGPDAGASDAVRLGPAPTGESAIDKESRRRQENSSGTGKRAAS